MIIRTTEGYIWMGTAIHYLIRADQKTQVHNPDYILDNIEGFLQRVKNYEFSVTEQLAFPLAELASKLKKELDERISSGAEIETWAKTRYLDSDEHRKLIENAQKARDALIAEAGLKKAYILHSTRYNVDKLLDDVPSLMPEGVFERMPFVARTDMKQAGRALAFELPTAAAFHTLRATEDVLKEFYEEIVKRDRIKSRMWGDITKHLSTISRPIPKDLISQLDNVRTNFRNPTQHPDKIYELDEAHELFPLCIGLIHRMQKYLDSRNRPNK